MDIPFQANLIFVLAPNFEDQLFVLLTSCALLCRRHTMPLHARQPQPDLVVLFLTINLDSHLISSLEDLKLWQHHLVLDRAAAALAEVARAWRLQVTGP